MYQSRSGSARQVVGTGLMVGAIQLTVGAALLAAFAGGAIQTVIHQTLKDNNWVAVPPLPSPAVPPKQPTAQRPDPVAAPTPAIDGRAPPTVSRRTCGIPTSASGTSSASPAVAAFALATRSRGRSR